MTVTGLAIFVLGTFVIPVPLGRERMCQPATVRIDAARDRKGR